MRRDVELAVEDGTVLRGYLHAGEAAAPAVVMAHGFSGVKEQIDHYAAAFAAAGFTALVFDHRGFGGSDGAPRLEVNHARQLQDWRDVITRALALPEVEAGAGVGLWGSSFAGGLAMVLGAVDPRVTCVVSQIPHVSGPRNARQMFDTAGRRRLRDALVEDRAARAGGAEPRRVPVFSDDPDALVALPPAMSRRYIDRAEAQTPAWRNEVTLRSLESMIEFEPAAYAGYISPKPFLMIVGRNDECTFSDLQLSVYEDAREPKRLVVHPGGHFDTYTDHFAQTSGAAIDWFREHLAPGASAAAPSRLAA